MTDMTLERWLTGLATDGTPTAGPVSLDSTLVEELAGVLLVDPPGRRPPMPSAPAPGASTSLPPWPRRSCSERW
jgi:hypothetical protein